MKLFLVAFYLALNFSGETIGYLCGKLCVQGHITNTIAGVM